ncbi:MAG TPA: hypothetical protein DDY58_08285 [Terrisporobacter glycolicus]|uniref:hypothetical protein n=1 Tax=Terrisporobacter TaxID=1505652 RepID=UPI000E8C313D|nr:MULTISPECIES: hypothetical protein [Terrisporobacter]MBN9648615.1 hypothetical protein [Terrisporobacter glycolicus]UPA31183.1 hypothetical protein L0P85_03325 [Terrisporobacter glycolicus]HBI92418.1 hypothetical protein [Terrisporobacter hibernicus]
MKVCKCNNIFCPSTAKKLFDSNNNMIEINSNFPMNFNICDDVTLPKNSKIEILETNVDYNITGIEKEMLINGIKINCDKSLLYDCIYIENNLINLPKDNNRKILLAIAQSLKIEIVCNIEMSAIAHTDCGEKIYFKAIGESKDPLNTTLISKCCIPNNNSNFIDTYIELNNCISTIVNPDYIFLSPVYDSCCNINNLLGNVYVNYKINLELICYKKIRKCLCTPVPKCSKYPCYKKSF